MRPALVLPPADVVVSLTVVLLSPPVALVGADGGGKSSGRGGGGGGGGGGKQAGPRWGARRGRRRAAAAAAADAEAAKEEDVWRARALLEVGRSVGRSRWFAINLHNSEHFKMVSTSTRRTRISILTRDFYRIIAKRICSRVGVG